MEARLFYELSKKINDWINENCEREDWPDVCIGKKTSALMAQAAGAVFDGIEEAQDYALSEGFFNE